MTALAVLAAKAGAYMVRWSWQAAIVIAVAWLIILLDRRKRSFLRCRVWEAALAALLLLPWAPSLIANVSWVRYLRHYWFESATPARSGASPQLLNAASANAAKAVEAPAPAVSTRDRETPLVAFAGVFWIVGIAIAGGRALKTQLSFRSRLKNDLRAECHRKCEGPPPVVRTSAVSGPALYGWLRPLILLPHSIADWSTAEEQALMILHERIHYRRRDHWLSGLAALLRTIFFFHPLVRLACRRLRTEIEFACDQEILGAGVAPQDYAETILKVAEHSVRAGAVCPGMAFASAAILDERIERLFDHRPPAVALSVVCAVFVLSLPVACFGIAQSNLQLTLPQLRWAVAEPPVVAAPVAPVRTIRLASPKPAEPQANAPAVAPDPIEFKVDALKVSSSSTAVILSFLIPESRLTFADDGFGVRRASGTVLMKLTDVTARVGVLAEDTFVREAAAAMPSAGRAVLYQKRLEIAPGLYRLDVVIKDDRSGATHVVQSRLVAPQFPDGFSSSPLMMADAVGALPPNASSATFQIGNLTVRPTFKRARSRDEELSFALQVYGLSINPATGRAAAATIETAISRDGSQVRRLIDNVEGGPDLTIIKTLPLMDFEPGYYSIVITVTDTRTGQSTRTGESFMVH